MYCLLAIKEDVENHWLNSKIWIRKRENVDKLSHFYFLITLSTFLHLVRTCNVVKESGIITVLDFLISSTYLSNSSQSMSSRIVRVLIPLNDIGPPTDNKSSRVKVSSSSPSTVKRFSLVSSRKMRMICVTSSPIGTLLFLASAEKRL